MNSDLAHHGVLEFGSNAQDRHLAACAIAGAIAELGVQELRVTDPRVCTTRRLQTRACDLPSTLSEAAPGTMIEGEGIALLVHADRLEWRASVAINVR